MLTRLLISLSIGLVFGAIIGYKLRPECPSIEPGKSDTVTIIHEKSKDGTTKETKIIEKKTQPIVTPTPIPRYTLGIMTDFDRIGILGSYRPFEKIPISIGGYVIPNRNYGLAIVFTF